MDAQREDGGENGHDDGDGIDGVRAVEEGVGDASDGRPGDGCDLEGAGIPGYGVGKVFFGNQLRQNGAAHREAETAADSNQHQNEIDEVNRLRNAPTDGQQQRRAEAVASIAPGQELASVEEIGGVSGEEKEDEAGRELGETDVSEIERALGDFVDLPADGYGLHLERYHDEEARQRVADEVGMGEGDTAGQARVFGGEHSLLLCHKVEQHRLRCSRGGGPLARYGQSPVTTLISGG